MKFFPKTVGGVSIYIFVVFALVSLMFLQEYGWFDSKKFLAKK